jgi:hypothetical protein
LINYNSLFSRQKRYLAHLKFLLFHAARRAFGRVDFLRMATGGFPFFRVGAAWMDGLSLAAAPPDLADLTRGDTAAPAAGHIVRRLNGFESQMTVDGAPTQRPGRSVTRTTPPKRRILPTAAWVACSCHREIRLLAHDEEGSHDKRGAHCRGGAVDCPPAPSIADNPEAAQSVPGMTVRDWNQSPHAGPEAAARSSPRASR